MVLDLPHFLSDVCKVLWADLVLGVLHVVSPHHQLPQSVHKSGPGLGFMVFIVIATQVVLEFPDNNICIKLVNKSILRSLMTAMNTVPDKEDIGVTFLL